MVDLEMQREKQHRVRCIPYLSVREYYVNAKQSVKLYPKTLNSVL